MRGKQRLFRRKHKDEMDLAAERLVQILHSGVKNVETEIQTLEEEKPIEEPQLEKQRPEEITKEKIDSLPPDEVIKILNPINEDLERIEDVLEKIHPKIESISKLLPTLGPVKELLQRDIAEKTKEKEKQSVFLNELTKQEEDINREFQKKQQIKEKLEKEIYQMENELAQIHKKIPQLTTEKERIDADVTQREENLHIIEEYIKRILNLNKNNSSPISEAS